MDWIRRLDTSLLFGNEGLLDESYQSVVSVTLTKDQFMRLLGKFFWIPQLVRVFSYMALFQYLKEHGIESNFDNFGLIQEGWCNLLRISQTHFPPKAPSGVPMLEVNGVKSIGFRITTATAKLLFGNKVVPLLSVNDPAGFEQQYQPFSPLWNYRHFSQHEQWALRINDMWY